MTLVTGWVIRLTNTGIPENPFLPAGDGWLNAESGDEGLLKVEYSCTFRGEVCTQMEAPLQNVAEMQKCVTLLHLQWRMPLWL